MSISKQQMALAAAAIAGAMGGATLLTPTDASAQVVPPGCQFPPGGVLTCDDPVIVNPNPGGDVTVTTGDVTNTNTNTNTNTANGGSATANGGSVGPITIGGNNYRAAAASANAPTIVNGSPCTKSWSLAFQIVGGGLGGGRSTPDAQCLAENRNYDFRRGMLDNSNVDVVIGGIVAQCEYDPAVCRAMDAPETAWSRRLRASAAPAPVIVSSSATYTPAGAPVPVAAGYAEEAGRVPPRVPAPTVQ